MKTINLYAFVLDYREAGKWCLFKSANVVSIFNSGTPVIVRATGRPDEGVFPARAAIHIRVHAHPGNEPQPGAYIRL